MRVDLVRPGDLDASQLGAWRRIQRDVRTFAGPFFSPEFTLACAAVRSDVFIALISDGGALAGFFPFQRGALGVGQAVAGERSNYQGVIVEPSAAWDARTLVRACRLRRWTFDHLVAAQEEFRPYWTRSATSPLIELRDGFAAYAGQRKQNGSRLIPRVREKERRLAREVGPVHFAPHVADGVVLRQLMDWKSEQYVRTGEVDRFAVRWNVRLLETLHGTQRGQEFAGVLAALYAGEELAAAVFGLRAGEIFHWWFPTYAPSLARYSPGLILLVKLAEHANDMGVTTIDLGKDDADYKLRMANGHVDLREGAVSANAVYGAVGRLRTLTRDAVLRSPLAGPALRAVRHTRALAERSDDPTR